MSTVPRDPASRGSFTLQINLTFCLHPAASSIGLYFLILPQGSLRGVGPLGEEISDDPGVPESGVFSRKRVCGAQRHVVHPLMQLSEKLKLTARR